MLGCIFELLETLLLTVVIFLVVQLFAAQPYQVQQESMENTLMPDQYVLVDKLTPRFDPYHRGHVFVNGVQISEPYVFAGQPTLLADGGSKQWTLGPNQLFVMGDHRQASQDSREFGPIDKSAVVGRAWIRYWPISQFGFLPQGKQMAAPSSSPASTRSP
jgi:signal peptidase I